MNDAKIISLEDVRRKSTFIEKECETPNAHMVLNISVFSIPEATYPFDILISATDEDNLLGLSALFEPQYPNQHRLLSLANGLDKLASLMRKTYRQVTDPPTLPKPP